MAFVTFETQEARLRILHEYDVFWICGNQPVNLKFDTKDVMKVKSAPPPSTLLWENQEITICNRILRLFLAFLLFTSILGITAGLSFVTDSNRVFASVLDIVSGESYVMCGGKYDNATSLVQAAQLAKDAGDNACLCDYEIIAPKAPGSDDNGFLFVPGGMCSDYAFGKATSIGKEVGLSFVILVINLIIFKVVLVTAEFMKFKNVIDREFAVLRAIFLITLINTAVICVLVNTDFARLTGTVINDVKFDDGTTLIRIGQFVDFEPGWYSRVGVELFIIGILNIFGPHLLPMLRYTYHELERRYFAPYAVSQQVLNEMYIGEEFLLSVRLAQTLMMIFFVLLFSSGMPIMYFVGLVSVFVSYWLDKFYFLRLARTPPQFDTALQVWMVKTIEWAVIAHCLVGFWMYSSPRMFPLTPDEAQDSLLSDLSSSLQITAQDASNITVAEITFVNEMSARFVRTESIVMLACAALILLIKSLKRLRRTMRSCARPAHALMNMVRALRGKQYELRHVNKYIVTAPNFETALQTGRIAGIRSYNILANPFYQRVFQMQDGVEERDKHSHGGESHSSPDGKTIKGTRDAKGFQSLQDALNIRKGTAVSSIESRAIYGNGDKSSVGSSMSKQTTALYAKKDTQLLKEEADSQSVNGVERVNSQRSVKSTKSVKSKKVENSDAASTVSSKSAEKEDTMSVVVVAQPLEVTLSLPSSPAIEEIPISGESPKEGQ